MDKYKRYVIIAIIAMIVPILYQMTVTHHEVEYQVGNYQVKENFQIKNKKHIYDFIIQKNKEEYSYRIIYNDHKRKKEIKEIKEYKEKDITCILPIYKNNNQYEIYCSKKKEQVSKDSLKDNDDFKKILKKAKKYKIKNITTGNQTKSYKNITIYSKNIPKEDTILIWNYKGIVGINSEETFYQNFIEKDLYDNIMAITTSRYFVLFENTSVNGIEMIHYYDLKKNKYSTMKLKEKISKDSYINGVEKDLIYVTDRKKKKQYTINIKKETCKEIESEDNYFIKYENGVGKYIELKDFFSKDQFFQNERIKDKTITKSEDLILEGDIYYFREGDKFYKQMKEGNRIFLFTEPEIETWKVYEDEIILKREDSIYIYNDKEGLQKVLEYNELKYNDNAIYYLWK